MGKGGGQLAGRVGAVGGAARGGASEVDGSDEDVAAVGARAGGVTLASWRAPFGRNRIDRGRAGSSAGGTGGARADIQGRLPVGARAAGPSQRARGGQGRGRALRAGSARAEGSSLEGIAGLGR